MTNLWRPGTHWPLSAASDLTTELGDFSPHLLQLAMIIIMPPLLDLAIIIRFKLIAIHVQY
jgi:hypothetical protein